MDKLCRIRDLQRAVNQFEAAFEKRYGICLNEGMTLCSLSKTERLCPGELGGPVGPHALQHARRRKRQRDQKSSHDGQLEVIVDHRVAAVLYNQRFTVVFLDIRCSLAEQQGHLFVFHCFSTHV